MRIVVILAPLFVTACVAAQSSGSADSSATAGWSCGTAGLLGKSSAFERCAYGEPGSAARVAAAAQATQPQAAPPQSTAPKPAAREEEMAAASRESTGTSQSRRGFNRQDVGTAGALDMIRTITPLR